MVSPKDCRHSWVARLTSRKNDWTPATPRQIQHHYVQLLQYSPAWFIDLDGLNSHVYWESKTSSWQFPTLTKTLLHWHRHSMSVLKIPCNNLLLAIACYYIVIPVILIIYGKRLQYYKLWGSQKIEGKSWFLCWTFFWNKHVFSSFTIQLSFIPNRAQYETEFSSVDFQTSVDTENVPIVFLIKQGDAPHLWTDL